MGPKQAWSKEGFCAGNDRCLGRYCRGLNNHQHCGPIFLIELYPFWLKLPWRSDLARAEPVYVGLQCTGLDECGSWIRANLFVRNGRACTPCECGPRLFQKRTIQPGDVISKLFLYCPMLNLRQPAMLHPQL